MMSDLFFFIKNSPVFSVRFAQFLLAFFLSCYCQLNAQTSITLSADLRDAPRKLLHSKEILAVEPGLLTLAFPQWIGNEHAPAPLTQQVGVCIKGIKDEGGSDELLRWTRDPINLYLYRVSVPEGVHSIEITFDFITSDKGGDGHASSDANLAVLDWNTVILYPYHGPDTRVAEIMVMPTVILPGGWRMATALKAVGGGARPVSSSVVNFQSVSLDQLVDSPMISGRYLREIELAPEVSPRHFLDIVADRPEDLEVPSVWVDDLSRAVRQAGILFHSHHYEEYRFLITLSDNISGAAIDHLQSLDDRRPANFFQNESRRKLFVNYTIHDFLHSWNGKYRRPEGMATSNFQAPVNTSGLWVYEGLTAYLSDVMAVRTGIWTKEELLEALASTAAYHDRRPGMQWRDLDDVDLMAYPLWSSGDSSYDKWRLNGFDFYSEGELIWLDIDVTIRNKSNGRKSLNDFLALFYGPGGDPGAKVVRYSFEDIVSFLNKVFPYDWETFLTERIHSTSMVPLQGITGAGYKLVYKQAPDDDFQYSLGMSIGRNGVITDVLMGGIAYRAGFGPGMKIFAVNGQPFTLALLKLEIDALKATSRSLELRVENTGVLLDLRVNYHGGQRHPVLESLPNTPDRIAEIVQPMAIMQ